MNTTEKVNLLLIEFFEIDAEKLIADARLVEDLGLDSLDAVDMLVVMEENFNKKIDADVFVRAKTLSDIYNILEELDSNSECTA